MKKTTTNSVMMVRPVRFNLNKQTAVNNFFQPSEGLSDAQEKALGEFDNMVEILEQEGIDVHVIQDTLEPHTPDSIFPNNWVSFHANGDVGLYPMFAENRRLERRMDILETLYEAGFEINEVYDYSEAEQDHIFLEGTGSVVLDRKNELAYAAISQRTDVDLLVEFCEDFEYAPIVFHAYQTHHGQRKLIYHTNVMMAIAERYVLVCLDSIDDKFERKQISSTIKKSGKELIALSEQQLSSFAGNALELIDKQGNSKLMMSQSGVNSLTDTQKQQIEKHSKLVGLPISTIETLGGGSVRCMLAEIFLPKNVK